MIEVRIRHEDELKAVPLCTWDPAKLDAVILLIHAWGLSFRDQTSSDWELSGSFVLKDGEAFFDVLISDPEPAS